METNTTSFTIRPALHADVASIHAMILELADFEGLSCEVQSDGDDLHRALFGERPAAEAFVACSGDDVAGFALFFTHYSTFAGKPGIYLEDLFVRPQFRSRGIGKQLLIRIAQTAIERNCARYEWSVLDWNQNAIRFYESCGAEMQGDWRRMRVSGDALERLAGRS